MSDARTPVIEYISKLFAAEDHLLQNVLHQQKEGGGPMMNIGPDQGKFLYLLTQIHRPKSILEVGSYFGYSSIWIARALEKLGQGLLTCAEISEKQCEIIKNNLIKANLNNFAEVKQGSGIDLMQKFIDESKTFDMIFIDADKNNYPNYFKLSSKLLNSGALLLIDNCLWDGKVVDQNFSDLQTETY